MDILLIAIVVFIAVFIQCVAGFGLPLVAMSLLLLPLGVMGATPLVALITLTVAVILTLHYGGSFRLGEMRPVILAVLVGIPFGLWLIHAVDQRIVSILLGSGIVLYAGMELFKVHLPNLSHRLWAYGFGFVAGVLASSYNLGGPVIVVYGAAGRWQPSEFRRNMQIFFVLSSLMAIVTHIVAGNYTASVIQNFAVALPAIGAGILVGTRIERFIPPVIFRRIVLIVLIAMGLNLIF